MNHPTTYILGTFGAIILSLACACGDAPADSTMPKSNVDVPVAQETTACETEGSQQFHVAGRSSTAYYELDSKHSFWANVAKRVTAATQESEQAYDQVRKPYAELTSFAALCGGTGTADCAGEFKAAFASVDDISPTDLLKHKLIGPFKGVFKGKAITFVANWESGAPARPVVVKDNKVAVLHGDPTYQNEEIKVTTCGPTAWTQCGQPNYSGPIPLGFLLYDISDQPNISVVSDWLYLKYDAKQVTVKFTFTGTSTDKYCSFQSLDIKSVK